MLITKREEVTKQVFCKLPMLCRKLRPGGSLLLEFIHSSGWGGGWALIWVWLGGGRGGRLFEAGRLLTFSAFRIGAYSRWALIRGWALIRINTVNRRPQTDWYSAYKLNRTKLSVTHVRKDHPHCTWLLKQVYQGTDKIHPLWQSNSQLHRLESKRHFAVSSQLRTSEDTAKEQHKQWTPCQWSCHHFFLHIFLKLDLCLFVCFLTGVPQMSTYYWQPSSFL